MNAVARPDGQPPADAGADSSKFVSQWSKEDHPRYGGMQKLYLMMKSAADWMAAFIMLLFCSPLLIALAVLVKLTSSGPAFYCQRRVGRDGKIYRLYKLRTMVKDAEAKSGAVWSKPGDARITPVGMWLRNTHLDEMPQLLNVLSGRMSLIGPRPERPEIIPELERRYPQYTRRLRVKPGVTGLAQMLHPADTDIASVRKKLAFDLYYVDRVSLMLDLRISVSTFMYFLAEVAEIWSKLAVKQHGEQVEEILDRLESQKLAGWEVNVETGIPSPTLVDRQTGRHAVLDTADDLATDGRATETQTV